MTRPKATQRGVDDAVPRTIRVGAAASWRLLLIAATVGVVGWLIGRLAVVTLPVAIALLLSALFAPLVARLERWRLPRAVATALALIIGLSVVGGVFTLVITTFTAGLPDMRSRVEASIQQINTWLQQGPLHLSQNQLDQFLNGIVRTIKQNEAVITNGALTTAGTVGEVGAGILLTLFVLIFFLYDGGKIWRYVLRGVPGAVRVNVDIAGRRGFASLVSYVRATVIVAVVDAVAIGVGLAIIGVPLAVPLATLVFLGAFVPIVGAVVAGGVAVLVALVANGLVAALIVLAVVVGVMQFEGHVLQPLLLGRAVRLHPLAVVLAIAVGVAVAGVPGALTAVPLLAVLNSGIRSLVRDTPPPPLPDEIDMFGPDGADPHTPDGEVADGTNGQPNGAANSAETARKDIPEPAGVRDTGRRDEHNRPDGEQRGQAD